VGQLLRYMGWVKENMETSQPVRGMIVAKEITSDLKLAASQVRDVRLIEYKITFELSPV
jgi:endonuclease